MKIILHFSVKVAFVECRKIQLRHRRPHQALTIIPQLAKLPYFPDTYVRIADDVRTNLNVDINAVQYGAGDLFLIFGNESKPSLL